MEQLALRVHLRDWARFETFVAGPNAAAVAALADTGPAGAHVVWLWGRAGTGKTHLLQAACAAAGAAGAATAYIDLRDTTEPERLEGCEMLATVCLDSLEVVAGDAGWNAALFRLHTLMQDLRGRLVVASRAGGAAISTR